MAKWLGVDFAGPSIRLALLRSTYRRTSLEALREEPLSSHETASAALRAAMAGLKAEASATSLPGSRCFLRYLALPAAVQKELSNVLAFEVESTLPFELDDAVMDHRLLRTVGGSDLPGTIPILAGVANTEEVRDRIGLVLRGTGQEPQRVGIGALPLSSLTQIVPALAKAELTAILDLDDEHTDLLILRRGEPRFVRTLTRGARHLPAEAAALSRDLKQTIGAWRVAGGEPLEVLFVVGSGRHIPGLDAWIQSELGVTALDLPRPALDKLTPDHEAQLPRFAKAIGLALSLSRRATDLDLRQGPVEAQQSYRFLRDKTPLLAGLGAALAVSFGFSIFAEMSALSSQREGLEQQLAMATQAHFGTKTSDPKAAADMLETAITGKTDDPVPMIDAFGMMVELSERIPNEITHDIAELDYNRGDVIIKGIVPKIDDAHIIAAKLEEHECFHDVSIKRTTHLKNQDKHKYTLEFSSECKSEAAKKGAKGKKTGKPTSGKSKKGAQR
jgi:general secretion pathway protein L